VKTNRTLLVLAAALTFLSGVTLNAQQPRAAGRRTVWIYLYPSDDLGADRRSISQRAARENVLTLVPVQREVSVVSPARGALEALIAGPTEEEKEKGLLAPHTDRLSIASLKIISGTARVAFTSSCTECPHLQGDLAVWRFTEAIQRTLKQFPNVRRVVICLDGYEDFGDLVEGPNKRCDGP
jgi:hypothetical protein